MKLEDLKLFPPNQTLIFHEIVETAQDTSTKYLEKQETYNNQRDCHLVVLVHGLHGNHYDLRSFKN